VPAGGGGRRGVWLRGGAAQRTAELMQSPVLPAVEGSGAGAGGDLHNMDPPPAYMAGALPAGGARTPQLSARALVLRACDSLGTHAAPPVLASSG
jgi:hypothetical protein